MKKRLALLAALLGTCSCRQPSEFNYMSEAGDYSVVVPYGWKVFQDTAGTDFVNTTFTGPFDPDFYRGTPSFSIRWHARNKPHVIYMAGTEVYGSGDDYIDKIVREIYGPDALFEQPVHPVQLSGWAAKQFVVSAPMPVPKGDGWGVSRDDQGQTAVLRKHAYAVLPMDNGFYVLIYPATVSGFPKYQKDFERMLDTFRVATDGPGGQKIP
jgi:hypothetical protein